MYTFLSHAAWRFHVSTKIERLDKVISYIQKKMRNHMLRETHRFELLQKQVKDEIAFYKFDMKKASKKDRE
jgi:hypothetical protein